MIRACVFHVMLCARNRLDKSTDQAENIYERYSVKIIPFQKERKRFDYCNF